MKFHEISSAPSAFHEIDCCSTLADFRMECHFNEISRAAAASRRFAFGLADHCRRHRAGGSKPRSQQRTGAEHWCGALSLSERACGGPVPLVCSHSVLYAQREPSAEISIFMLKFHRNFTGPSRPARRRLGMHEISIEISIS